MTDGGGGGGGGCRLPSRRRTMPKASKRMVVGSASALPAGDLQGCATGSNSDEEDESVSSSSSSQNSSDDDDSSSSSCSSSPCSSSSSGDEDSQSTRSNHRRLDRQAQLSASAPVEVISSRNANVDSELQRSIEPANVPTLRRRPPHPSTLLRLNPHVKADPILRASSGDYEIERKSGRLKATNSSFRRRVQSGGSESQRSRRRRRRRQQHGTATILWWRSTRHDDGGTSRSRWVDCCSGISTLLVCSSFFVWIICVVLEQSAMRSSARIAYGGRLEDPSATQQRLRARAAFGHHPPPPRPPSSTSFVRGVWNGVQAMFQSSSSATTHTQSKPRKSVEELDTGCVLDDWQLANRPTCNELHSIDLGEVIREWKQRVREREHPSTTANRTGLELLPRTTDPARDPIGYLSDAGLWRTVWAVRDTALSTRTAVLPPPLVLKLMKLEHDMDARNLDRHRREAVAMERVTSSPYVANIFGYCGTTVMTEYLGATLHTLIKAKDDESIRARWGLDNSTYLLPSTPQGRLQMALHAARGLQALHENSIVHADLQDQQYLLSTTTGHDGRPPRLVLNDFNRCRFVAHRTAENGTNNATTSASRTACTFRIPTAPGVSRSPEEYAYEELTAQIDVYSLANVLHQILTGDDPWEGWSALEISNQVQKGVKPVAPPELLQHPSDQLLQNLTLRAYDLDPNVRIRASELVRELEKALEMYF